MFNNFFLSFLIFKKKNAILKVITYFFFSNLFKLKKKIYSIKNLKDKNKDTNNIFNYFFLNYKKKYQLPKIVDVKKKNFSNILKFRNSLNLFLFKKKYYKKKYYNFLKKNKNFLNPLQILKKLFNLQFVLIKLNFFLNFSDYYFFLKNNFIFKNKLKVDGYSTIFKKNDIIEIVYIKNFLFYQLKIFYSLNKIKNINFLKKKINLKFKKFNNNFFLKKIKMDFYNKNEIINMFEVDYFSLTFIFLKNNFNLFFLYFKLEKKINFFYLNFLKWKLLS